MIPVVVIMGPTAVGKSDLAVDIAKKLDGEVINADSMQVYKYLKIGTAAPDEEMLRACPHHLFGILELDEQPDAGWYGQEASKVIKDIYNRGKLPVVVGGTFFWIKVLLEGIAKIPRVKPLRKGDVENPYEELKKVDPELASKLSPNDTQRILRGLEVYSGTGKPLSWYHKQKNTLFGDFKPLKIWLDLPREVLYERINKRLNKMVEEGLIDEVKSALAMGYTPDVPPLKNGGYRYVVQYVLGRLDLQKMIEETGREHRNYAKRQITWLRREEKEGKVQRFNPHTEQDQIYNLINSFLEQTLTP